MDRMSMTTMAILIGIVMPSIATYEVVMSGFGLPLIFLLSTIFFVIGGFVTLLLYIEYLREKEDRGE